MANTYFSLQKEGSELPAVAAVSEEYDDSFSGDEASEEHQSDEEKIDDTFLGMNPQPLEDNVYSFFLVAFVFMIHERSAANTKRALLGGLLFFVTFAMKGFLVYSAFRLVSPYELQATRSVYGRFETVMYMDAANVSHTTASVHGYPRGVDGFFNPANFANLTTKEKTVSCQISLSQPVFIFSVVLLWSMTAFWRIKASVHSSLRIAFTPHKAQSSLTTDHKETVFVKSLTLWSKVLILVVVQFPRILMNLLVLYIGTHWLLATVGFGDTLLNAVALEFVLNIADLFYYIFVPKKGQILVQRTVLAEVETGGLVTFVVVVLAIGYAIAHVFLWQDVLPDYKWDIHAVCETFLKSIGENVALGRRSGPKMRTTQPVPR